MSLMMEGHVCFHHKADPGIHQRGPIDFAAFQFRQKPVYRHQQLPRAGLLSIVASVIASTIDLHQLSALIVGV